MRTGVAVLHRILHHSRLPAMTIILLMRGRCNALISLCISLVCFLLEYSDCLDGLERAPVELIGDAPGTPLFASKLMVHSGR